MVIAVPSLHGALEAQFTNARSFTLARVLDGVVVETSTVPWEPVRGNAAPVEEEAVVGLLRGHEVDVVLAGTIGYELQRVLKGAGFTVYSGLSGDVTEALESFLRDDIEPAVPTNRPLHGPPWAR
jgi:predicted Fe-Mo cluster-binding NifX family protein